MLYVQILALGRARAKVLYTRYPIVALGLPAAKVSCIQAKVVHKIPYRLARLAWRLDRPSAHYKVYSKGILHTSAKVSCIRNLI